MRLTAEQVAWACEKREAGWSTARIGMKLGVSSGAINYQCLKNGAISPRQRRHDTPTERLVYTGRDGRTFRTFTPEEDEQLLGYARDGKKPPEIATLMSRGRTSVVMRLMLLELREDMPEREGAAR
jgi:hypothetical protein